MICCCSMAGTKACEQCRENSNMGYNYVSTQPIIDFDFSFKVDELVEDLKVGE